MSGNEERWKNITPVAKELLMRETLRDCQAFLVKWDPTAGHRSEAMEDAFVAITELERETRQDLDAFLNPDRQQSFPF